MPKAKKLIVENMNNVNDGYLTDTELDTKPTPTKPKTKRRTKTKRKRTKLSPQPNFIKRLQELTESSTTNNNGQPSPQVTTRPRVQILPGAMLRKTKLNKPSASQLMLQPYPPKSNTRKQPTLSNVLSKLANVKSSMMTQSPSNINNKMVMGKCPKCHNMHMIPRHVAADTPPRYTNYEAMATGYLSDNEDNNNTNNNTNNNITNNYNNNTNENNTNNKHRKYKRRKTMRLLSPNYRNEYVNNNLNETNNDQNENNNNAPSHNTNEQNYTRTITATVNTKSINGKMNRQARVEVDNSRDNLVKVVEMHNGKKTIKYVPRE